MEDQRDYAEEAFNQRILDTGDGEISESEAIARAAGTYNDVDEVLDVEQPELLAITTDEAGDWFDQVVRDTMRGLAVDLYPEDGGELVEAILYGVERDAQWYGTVEYRDAEEWEPVGPLKSLRVRRIHVH